MIDRICARCGKHFKTDMCKVNRGWGVYCSKSCARGNPRVEIICKTCGTKFINYKNRIYCSKKCEGIDKRKRIDRICKNCGITFKCSPGSIARGEGIFCSNKCFGEYERGENHHNWKGGISFKPYCTKFNKNFKNIIRRKFKNKCFICGKNDNRNLYVHHIDYNKNSICNGNEWAFIPLCGSCHSKTNFNRWYWFNLFINYWIINDDINFGGEYNIFSY